LVRLAKIGENMERLLKKSDSTFRFNASTANQHCSGNVAFVNISGAFVARRRAKKHDW
jgi:hypothetical protein